MEEEVELLEHHKTHHHPYVLPLLLDDILAVEPEVELEVGEVGEEVVAEQQQEQFVGCP